MTWFLLTQHHDRGGGGGAATTTNGDGGSNGTGGGGGGASNCGDAEGGQGTAWASVAGLLQTTVMDVQLEVVTEASNSGNEGTAGAATAGRNRPLNSELFKSVDQ